MPRLRTTAAMGGLLAAALIGALLPTAPAAAGPNHDRLVATVPQSNTPNIKNGRVLTIVESGSKIIAGGTFTQVANAATDTTIITRNYLLAFDKTTGVVDTAFVPAVDNEVDALLPGPTSGTVYVGGKFNTVNGVSQKGLALLNVADGSLVTTFKPPYINGAVNDLEVAHGHLIAAGTFTKAGGLDHKGLASFSPTTGKLDTYLNVQLTEHHNYDGVSGAKAAVGADKMALAPDGSRLAVIGNFKKADGLDRDQAVVLDLSDAAATIANWQTDAFKPRCAYWAFDSWIRNVAFAPDGSYFAIVSTGAPFPGTTCDTTTRWEAGASGSGLQPTWTNYTGGDTLFAVAITEKAVYVGGHFRWVNNSFGSDAAAAGAVGRASIAALDPVTGLPFTWNPGRNPRGVGVMVMYATATGLWLGYDTDYLGNYQYKRQRIGFFPLQGGLVPPANTVAGLPGNAYLAGGGSNPGVLYRVNTGGPTLLAPDGGPDWVGDSATSFPYRNDGSNTAAWSPVPGVDGTVPASAPSALFDTERWDPGTAPEMHWFFPVPAGKQVTVRLYFASRCSCTSTVGSRVFNVALDGTTVLDHFDIVASVGQDRGTMRSWTITSDGTVDIDFTHIVENPLINGIEIVDPNAPPPAPADSVRVRSYDGATGVGPTSTLSNPDATKWSNARGGFWVNGTLFYGMSDGMLYRRSFNGTTFGAPVAVDPYHDTDGIKPNWDTVSTGSGQTYAGVMPNFYGTELQNVTGMTYAAGKLYYTLAGQDGLFWRWFLPQSGAVGADRFSVAGAAGFASSGGLFTANNKLYMVDRSNGNLSARNFIGGVPSGSPTVLSGPSIDGNDWRARAVFLGP